MSTASSHSGVVDGSTPSTASPIVIRASPATVTALRPIFSVIRADRGVSTAPMSIIGKNTSPVPNADSARCCCSPVTPPPRSCRIEGSATFTTTTSNVMMKNPSTAAANVARESDSFDSLDIVTSVGVWAAVLVGGAALTTLLLAAVAAVVTASVMASMQAPPVRAREVDSEGVLTQPPWPWGRS